jgi:hypothetical protein
MRKSITLFLLIILLSVGKSFSQSAMTTETAVPTVYPKTVGYLSFILPIVTINKDVTTNDFTTIKTFAIGFPVGVNVLYSDKFGFSYEITPTIQAGNGSTKTSKMSCHQ